MSKIFFYMSIKKKPYEAAKESNLPSGGLHRPAGFEGRMGHQTPAAPSWRELIAPVGRFCKRWVDKVALL
jgi:hypothetical protein